MRIEAMVELPYRVMGWKRGAWKQKYIKLFYNPVATKWPFFERTLKNV